MPERRYPWKTRKDQTQFYQLADQLEAAAAQNDVDAFTRFDDILHVSIALATHNESLHRALEIYHSLSRHFWYAYTSRSAGIRRPRCRCHVGPSLA
jgi:DNA-binding GntR family transcriptional regulator